MTAFRSFPYLFLSNLFTVNGFSPSEQVTEPKKKNLLEHPVALLETNLAGVMAARSLPSPISLVLLVRFLLCLASPACVVQLTL